MLGGYKIIKLYERVAGRNFTRYYDQFKLNEFADISTKQRHQLERLRKLVVHAYMTVPYYRERFDALNIKPHDISKIDDIKSLPLLSRDDVITHYERMLSSAYPPSSLQVNATGGSTGTPMRFLTTREQIEARAAAAFFSYRMTGWDFMDKTIFFTGAPLNSSRIQDIIIRIKSGLMRQRRFSGFELGEEQLQRIHAYIRRTRPRVIFGFISSLVRFAQFLEQCGQRVHIPIIIQVGEMIYPHQQALIEQFLGGKVFKMYGARDAIAMGVECNQRCGLHANMDTLLVEILNQGREGVEKDGEVFITDLYSYGMPLIRYRIGDVARWIEQSCTCGRNTPLFEITQGRTSNILSTPDGRRISGLFVPHLFKEVAGKIQTYQVYQPDIEHLLIKIVKCNGFSERDEMYLMSALKNELGSTVDIHFEYPEQIPPEASGKFLFVKSDVPVNFGNF